MPDTHYYRLLMAFMFAVITAQASFAAFPDLDIAVSSALTDGAGTFVATLGPWPILNAVLKRLMELTALVVVFGTLAGWISGRLRHASLRCACFATLNIVLAPAVIVNLMLKSYVGRARPTEVVEFGGQASFTPAWQMTTQCARNCSFTSGEVAIATTLVLCTLVLTWPRLTPQMRPLAALSGLGLVVLVAALRLALGRHFLSDAVFSALISSGVALISYRMLSIGQARADAVIPDLQPMTRRTLAWVQTAAAKAGQWLRA